MLSYLFVMLCREQVEEDMKLTDQFPDFLSLDQHLLLSGKPSLKGVMDRLQETKQKTTLQVCFYSGIRLGAGDFYCVVFDQSQLSRIEIESK